MPNVCDVRVRFYQPSAALRPLFTTFYVTEIVVPDGGRVTDWLHPEWANLRICVGDFPDSEVSGSSYGNLAAPFTGPTSTTVRFTVGTVRMWGIGLLPLGWARLVGLPAHDYANRIFDAHSEAALAPFRALVDGVFGPETGGAPDEEAELARIEAHFSARMRGVVPDEARIVACHRALVDEDISTVAEMAEAASLPSHTLERLCRKHFGFPPRLLLRRQRFMRSLAQYMLDPSLRWIGAIDSHYHDQAQFVRDFHAFMGTSPSEYAAMPHPVLSAVMKARQEAAGAAVQALHLPDKG